MGNGPDPTSGSGYSAFPYTLRKPHTRKPSVFLSLDKQQNN